MKINRLISLAIATAVLAIFAVSCGVFGGNGGVKQITSLKSYDNTIDNKKKFVMVEFMKPTSTPCKMIAPNISVITDEMKDRLVVASVNLDDPFVAEERLTQRCRVEEVPCMILFENGLEVGRNVGYMTKEELRVWLGKYIK
ncbi:MAG: hypothetical protein J6Z26_07090 [Bacteroidales bacterium]|nr:hypothetical protein [Bacteroidales bacterium]